MIGSTAQAFSALGHASLLATGSLAVLAGSAIAWLRSTPRRFLGVIERRVVVEVEIRDDWMLFEWALTWLAAHPSMRRNRKWTAATRVKGSSSIARVGGNQTPSPDVSDVPGSSGYASEVEPFLVPGFGTYLLWFERRPVVLTRSQEEQKGGMPGSRPRQQITIRMFTRRRERVERLLHLIAASGQTAVPDILRVLCPSGEGWYQVEGIGKRDLETVILPSGVMGKLVGDMEAFLGGKERYRSFGIPYHRGYGLFGPPGGGKTSLVQALAGHFNLTLHVLNLPSIWSDDQLFSLIRRLEPRSILLVEDIDAALTGPRKPQEDAPSGAAECRGVSLSALLNVLDGVYSKDGMITFLTSNHPEHLDPALLRAGRIDVRVDLGSPTLPQAERLFLRFFPGDVRSHAWARNAIAHHSSMAELQGELAREVFQPVTIGPDESREESEALSLT